MDDFVSELMGGYDGCQWWWLSRRLFMGDFKVWGFASWVSGIAMGMKRSEKEVNGRAGKMFLCLIGVMLLLAGGVFEWLMIRSYQHAKATREWPQAEALVLRSDREERQITGSPKESRLNVLYGYSFGGNEVSTNRFSPRGAKWTKDESAVIELQKTYPVGSTHVAWIDPRGPELAILKHDTKAAGYTLWFPALIMVGGAGMIWGAVRKKGTV